MLNLIPFRQEIVSAMKGRSAWPLKIGEYCLELIDRLTAAESEITNQALEAASQARRALSAESERDQLREQIEAANNPIGFISQEEMKHLLNGATGRVLPCNFKPLGYLSIYAAPIPQQATPAESVQLCI